MAERVATAAPAAGWFRDPWDVEPLRWWDGQAWTGHTARSGDDDNGRRSGSGPAPKSEIHRSIAS